MDWISSIMQRTNDMDGAPKMAVKKHRRVEEFDVTTLPKFCDYSCRYGSFAPADAVGACRREQAVYCKLLKEFNNKNAPCAART